MSSLVLYFGVKIDCDIEEKLNVVTGWGLVRLEV
jgi:hypothetical protein